jgi:hypothetical protein
MLRRTELSAPVLALITVLFLTILATPAAHAQTFSVIHKFGAGDGGYPFSGITIKGGKLYGTTAGFVNHTPGSVFQISHVGSNWITTPLALFYLDGYGPAGNANFGPDGYLYSTTQGGGADNAGTVFSLVPRESLCTTAKCFWTENVVHEFTRTDGWQPALGDMVWDEQGNMYGTTLTGGAFHRGNVFQLTKSGNDWIETSIYDFTGAPDGDGPQNGLIMDSAGNLYGTTEAGGVGVGTVFKLTKSGNGWQESILYDFHNPTDGAGASGVTLDEAGNLYGVTQGSNGSDPTVFELSPSENGWIFKVLYDFAGQDFCGPIAAPTLDAAGNIYGTTVCLGAYKWGSVFKLTNTANGWVYSTLHDFTGGDDGAYPECNVAIDTDGSIYGTARFGGSAFYLDGQGVVWMIKP